MINTGSDNWIVNLFTEGLHHQNLSVIYNKQTYSIKAKVTKA